MKQTRPVLGRDALVGRDAELERLSGLVTAIDRGGLVVVEGEPGIGKSRLLAEVGVVARAVGGRVVRGVADEVDPTVLGLWSGPARALGLPRLHDPTVPADELRWEALELLSAALADGGPTVVLLDDLHWADDASLWVLERLLTDRADDPVLVLAGSRPAAEARSARWPTVRRRGEVLTLHGLPEDAVAALAADVGSAADAPSLHLRTGGNPLLVRELLAAGADTLPAAAADVLRGSIERGDADEADTLTALALSGGPVPMGVLAVARGLSADVVSAHLDSAAARDVLRDDGAGPWFRHALLTEAAASRPDRRARAEAHRAWADAWEAVGSDLRTRATVARHRLLAVPVVDPAGAAAEAEAVAADLVGARDPGPAAALMALAVDVLAAEAPGDVDLSVRSQVARAEALIALDTVDEAVAVAERARSRAAETDDALLRARAEVAAVTHHNPFLPDPERLARLGEVDAALEAVGGEAAASVRARLRGRRSVLASTFPDLADEADRLGDEAVALARSVGDPALIVDMLSDRHFAAHTVAGLDARGAAATEVIALSERAARPDLALLGHEWRVAAGLRHGDATAAVAALADLEAISGLMPSPRWRFGAALRRSGVMALLGDPDGALALAEDACASVAGVMPDVEVNGLDVGVRMGVALLYGTLADGFEPRYRTLDDAVGAVPVAFLQVRMATAELMLGRPDAARRRLEDWARRPEAALRGVEGLPTVALLGDAVTALGWSDPVPAIRAVLLPFRGMLPVSNAVGACAAIDDTLAGLALTVGDLPTAADHAAAAAALGRSMGAPAVEARALVRLAEARAGLGDAPAARSARDRAERLAEATGQALAPAPWAGTAAPPAVRGRADGRATLHLAAGRWAVTSPHGDGEVPDSLGMGQLAQLLAAPGTELAAVDLAGAGAADAVPLASDLGPALDARAKREYRQRITELRTEIDEADAHHDLARAEKHRVEMEALIDELKRAVGLGGRDRPQGSGAERSRVNVTRSLRRAIAGVEAVVPALGAHLRVSVRTGHRCTYAPEPAAALTWDVTAD